MTDIVILGAGGHGGETLETLEAMVADGADITVLGFVDDGPPNHEELHGYPVFGRRSWLLQRKASRPVVALGIGRPAPRAAAAAWVLAHGLEAPAIIHPTALVSRRMDVPQGVMLMSHSRLSLGVRIGEFAHLNHASSVSHDCRIGAFATLSPHVAVAGAVTLEEGVELGIGAVAIPGVRIGAWSMVGAGAVVTRDVPPNAVVIGVPARVVRLQPQGWHAPEAAR